MFKETLLMYINIKLWKPVLLIGLLSCVTFNSCSNESPKSSNGNKKNENLDSSEAPDKDPNAKSPSNTQKVDKVPYYFIAIHNEPDNNTEILTSAYAALEKVIAKADAYKMKLTLMFTHPWVDYLLDSNHPERKQKLDAWKEKGHEIAAHHHSINHPFYWDGYSVLAETEAVTARQAIKANTEPYYGTMTQLETKLKRLNANIKSGCLNEEMKKMFCPKV